MTQVLGVAAAVAYPFLVYAALDHFGPRGVAMVVLVVFAPGLGWRVARRGPRAALSGRGAVAAAVLALAAGAFALREAGLALLVPVVINLGLMILFGSTLMSERPLIERFARLQHPELEPPEVAWCRLWTVIWTGFFGFNVVLVSALALLAPLKWWVVYTGGIAYALMGVLFVVEYLLRKLRFGRYDDHLLDRALAWLLGADPGAGR